MMITSEESNSEDSSSDDNGLEQSNRRLPQINIISAQNIEKTAVKNSLNESRRSTILRSLSFFDKSSLKSSSNLFDSKIEEPIETDQNKTPAEKLQRFNTEKQNDT